MQGKNYTLGTVVLKNGLKKVGQRGAFFAAGETSSDGTVTIHFDVGTDVAKHCSSD